MALKPNTFADQESAVTGVHKRLPEDRTRLDAAIVLDRLISNGAIAWKGERLTIPASVDCNAEYRAWRAGK